MVMNRGGLDRATEITIVKLEKFDVFALATSTFIRYLP